MTVINNNSNKQTGNVTQHGGISRISLPVDLNLHEDGDGSAVKQKGSPLQHKNPIITD